MSKLEIENKILKEGIKSLLNYCDELYLYEEKEDLEKIKLMFEVLNNGN